MEKVHLEKFTKLEQKINLGIDLLEVAKSYCDFNYDKASVASTLSTVLEIILNNQKDVVNELDVFLAS